MTPTGTRTRTLTAPTKTPIGKIYTHVEIGQDGQIEAVGFSQPSSEPLEILDALAESINSTIRAAKP